MNDTSGYCSIASQYCVSPPGIGDTMRIRRTCFACGDFVCGKCSTVRKYYDYGKQRLCESCEEAYDGNDVRIWKRLYKRSGYPVSMALTDNRVNF